MDFLQLEEKACSLLQVGWGRGFPESSPLTFPRIQSKSSETPESIPFQVGRKG